MRETNHLERVLARSPGQLLLRWRHRRALTVLAYHGVSDADEFAWQARHLREEMQPVTLDQVNRALTGNENLPARAVLVTFDDGERSVLEVAAPILEEEGVPAGAFVIAGLLGTDLPFWWEEVEEYVRRGGRADGLPAGDGAAVLRALKSLPDVERRRAIEDLRRSAGVRRPARRQLQGDELRDLERRGVVIGNHTLTHPLLDRCTDAELEAEVVGAHEVLRQHLDRPPTSFAFPNGNFDARAARIIRELGYRTAFLFDHRVQRMPPGNPLRISRVRVSSEVSRDRFRILVSGLHPALHRALGRN